MIRLHRVVNRTVRRTLYLLFGALTVAGVIVLLTAVSVQAGSRSLVIKNNTGQKANDFHVTSNDHLITGGVLRGWPRTQIAGGVNFRRNGVDHTPTGGNGADSAHFDFGFDVPAGNNPENSISLTLSANDEGLLPNFGRVWGWWTNDSTPIGPIYWDIQELKTAQVNQNGNGTSNIQLDFINYADQAAMYTNYQLGIIQGDLNTGGGEDLTALPPGSNILDFGSFTIAAGGVRTLNLFNIPNDARLGVVHTTQVGDNVIQYVTQTSVVPEPTAISILSTLLFGLLLTRKKHEPRHQQRSV
jgi:hypothetical protein